MHSVIVTTQLHVLGSKYTSCILCEYFYILRLKGMRKMNKLYIIF